MKALSILYDIIKFIGGLLLLANLICAAVAAYYGWQQQAIFNGVVSIVLLLVLNLPNPFEEYIQKLKK